MVNSIILIVLILLILLVQESTFTVYHVSPDAENITSHHTITYYQEHGKLSSSHTQLYFQQGIFQLRTPLIISNVTNFSFIGSIHGKTIITCETHSAGILINNCDSIEIRNVIIQQCDYYFKILSVQVASNFVAFSCKNLSIHNSTFISSFRSVGLSVYNPLEFLSLFDVHANSLLVHVQNSALDTFINISQFQQIQHTSGYVLWLVLRNDLNKVNITLSDIIIYNEKAVSIDINSFTSRTAIIMNKLSLISKNWSVASRVIFLLFTVPWTTVSVTGDPVTYVQFNNCQFSSIKKEVTLFFINTHQINRELHPIVVHIKNSNFYNIEKAKILQSGTVEPRERKPLVTVILTNSTFKNINTLSYLISMADTHMILQGPVFFTNLKISAKKDAYLLKTSKDTILIKNYVEFSCTKSKFLLYTTYIMLESNAVLNITSNKFTIGISFPKNKDVLNYLLCAFQYINDNITNKSYKNDNFSVIISHNSGILLYSKKYSTSNCDWIGQDRSVFLTADPQIINSQLIMYQNNSFHRLVVSNQICICTDKNNYTCSTNQLHPAFPGQEYTLGLTAKNMSSLIANVRIDELPFTSCRTQTELLRVNIFQNTCTPISYNIKFGNRKSCELYLRGKSSSLVAVNDFTTLFMEYNQQVLDVYHISMIPCPTGFILDVVEGICQCDPLLQGTAVFITDCNINDQTILRPANSWITAHTVNNSHTYDVSLECPFDYCIPHQSYINLATPNLQCQFNRCGILCGHCPPGYSAVFGSSQCKHCSNVYLLIIIPIAIAGIVLVFLLFLLNLTVTDGSITPFIYYVNIVSINSAVFFPQHNSLYTHFTYTFVSIANLDLGIEMCFYNGMTGYAKMFLQLVFPFYLISIAILLIITSRYSTKVQRLTARRALPVLATLFLLSYTKILQSACIVLFFFSSSIHLPSKQTTTVWSVETSVIMFEVKFVFLFVVCLVLFVILMVFNLVLVFIRPLSRFKFINYFKPLLDAYQGPYKVNFYFWMGSQLLTRAMFFGLSALQKDIGWFIGSLLLCIFAGIHGQVHPFIRKEKNIQEFFFLLNLQGLFLIRLFMATNTAFVDALISIAALQFGVILINQTRTNMLQFQVNKLLNMLPLRCKVLYKAKHSKVQSIELSSKIPEKKIYNNFQEPLLELFKK